jgi:hypothetical protein
LNGQPSVNCTCRWIAADIDHHGTGPAPPQNAEAAKRWYTKAVALGFRPLVYESNGNGGYRLLIILSKPVESANGYGFIRWLISDWATLGLASEPEYFPRQKKIRPLDDPGDARGACGHWLRLFGRHHQREHHSRFWDGQKVLVGNDAVNWILDHCGDDPSLIPPEVFTAEFSEPGGKVRESVRKDRPKSFSSPGVTEPIPETIPLKTGPWDVRVAAPEINRTAAYPMSTLKRIVGEFSKQPEGHRHHFVVSQSNVLASMVRAGWISEEECLTGFRDAAVTNGMGEERFEEIDKAWESAMGRVDAHAPLGPSPDGQPSPGPLLDDDTTPLDVQQWPAPPDVTAYFGLMGEIALALEPYTEADPIAILVQSYIGFGNVIGRKPHARVGRTFHHANEYGLIIGQTSAGRKGTAWDEAAYILEAIDKEWLTRAGGGLSTGEGLIYLARDPLEGETPVKEKGTGRIIEYQDAILDHGVTDKRLMVIETEFSRPLQAMRREGSTLSAVMRQGWDGHRLMTKTKNNPYTATGAHVSVIGHTTDDELRRLLTEADLFNGFANRFLWIACRSTKLLPFGGIPPEGMVIDWQKRVQKAAAAAKAREYVGWSNDATELWEPQ